MNAKNEFPIVILGPAAGSECIFTLDGRKYLVDGERRAFPVYALSGAAEAFDNCKVRELVNGCLGGPIGTIQQPYWDSRRLALCGTLAVHSPLWLAEFERRPLSNFRLQIDGEFARKEFVPLGGRPGHFALMGGIEAVHGLYLVDVTAAGGYFL